MTFGELRMGDRLRLGSVVFSVEAVEPGGAVLASCGRWSVLQVHPSGAIADITGCQSGGRRGRPPRLIGYTLDDAKVAENG